MLRIKYYLLFSVFLILICYTSVSCNWRTENIAAPESFETDKENFETNYQTLVQSCYAEDSLNTFELFLPETIDGKKTSCTGIYNDSTVVLLLYTESAELTIHEIGLFDYNKNYYEKIFDIKPNQLFEICDISTEYMVLRFSEDDWKTSFINLYNFKKKTLSTIFEYSIDKNTESVYYNNNNSIIIYKEKIYFDNFYEDENGELRAELYEYDSHSNQLNHLSVDSQNPMIFENSIIFFAKNSKGICRNIISEKEAIKTDIAEELIAITSSTNKLFCIENKFTDHEAKTTLFQIKDITDDIEILCTYTAIGNLKSNQRYVSWTNYYEEFPCVYDINNNTLVFFNTISKGVNNYFFSDDYGILINTVDGKNQIYKFSSK